MCKRQDELEFFALDFLWFTYFGITNTEAMKDKRKAAYCCADRAYRDLCRRIPYRYSSSIIEKNKKKDQEFSDYSDLKFSFRKCVCSFIVQRIYESLIDKKMDFDTFHKDTCRSIISISNWNNKNEKNYKKLFKSDTEMNYGLAQKWLNMTIKNMIVMGLWDGSFVTYEQKLHIPLDSFILSAAGGTEGERIYKDDDVKHLGINAKDYFGNETWSMISDEEKYCQYQKEIQRRTKGDQLTWEHNAWIAQSKKEKL